MSKAAKERPTSRRSPGGLMALGRFQAKRPRFVVGFWVLLMGTLAILGHGLGGELEAHPLYISGTGADRAHEITLHKFGSDESMVVALRGPHGELERQGKRLVDSLERTPETLVISPWSNSPSIKGLRPNPQVAGIVVRVGHKPDETLERILEVVEERIESNVEPPVKASVTGLPKIFDSFSKASDSASKTGERIAIPVLLIVLLLVFRSVLAALIPVAIGASVVAGTEGVLHLLLGVFEVDAFALGAAGMMGLALGVDYSLLVVSRFRQERRKTDLPTATQVTVEATGRSIIPAGLGLCLAMLVAHQILPGAAVKSSALAIMVATLLSMFSALWMAPATALLLGSNLDRWSLPQGLALQGLALRLSSRISRNPFALTAVVLLVLILAGLASTLNSSVASPELLPPGSSARVQGEEVQDSLGPGWLAPIEVVVSGSGDPMTSPDRLHSLVAFQKQVEGDGGVQTVAGFSGIEHSLHPLSGFEGQLVDQQHSLSRLGNGLARAGDGATEGSSGLREAAAGSGRLGNGVGSAAAGAGLLVKGIDRAHTGSHLLSDGLGEASSGSGRLADSSSSISSSAGRLADALQTARKQSTELNGTVRATKSAMRVGEDRLTEAQQPLGSAEDRLATALQGLERMTVGATDPEYATVLRTVTEAIEYLSGGEEGGESSGVDAGIERARHQFDLGLYLAEQTEKSNEKSSAGAKKLAEASRKLDQGLERLADGTAQLSEGVSRLADEGGQLSPALRRLGEGTESLQSGLSRLGVKAGDLAGGLEEGVHGQDSLAHALRRMSSGLEEQSGESGNRLDRIRERSPGFFKSGYFYLASLDGAHKKRRDQASLLIDLDKGGHTARMMVIPRYPATTDEGKETLDRIDGDAQALAKDTGMEVVVGGLTASELELDQGLRDRSTVARIALMLITLIVLIVVLRALIIPIIAMFLNLLTVFASLGVLSLLFDGSLFGGPGYVDSAIIPAMMMVLFGLALDYEVFIFARMREEYLRTGDSDIAIENGLSQTAPVVTGAAFIMIAVFIAFSVSSFITLRNFGIAQATGVFIDAFIIRLIIVPALMRALGKWSWWMPRWLDRLIPGGQTLPGEWRAKE